jgi:hypothetical protein
MQKLDLVINLAALCCSFDATARCKQDVVFAEI